MAGRVGFLRFVAVWRGLALLAPLTLAACSVGPDFAPPDPMLPRSSFFGKPEPEPPLPEPLADALPDSLDPAWWRCFRDPELAALIARAAESNLDVKTATTRLFESRAQRGVAAAAAFPTINGSASYQREQLSNNGLVSLSSAFNNGVPIRVPPISVWQVGFDASWELDIWGHVQRQIEAAQADVVAAKYQRRDTLLAALAEVARDYIELRGVQAQIAIAKENLATANEILELTRTRAARGVANGLDVENAAAQMESVRAQLPDLANQESSYIDALGVLLDQPPLALRGELARAKPIPAAPPKPPVGVPSELARRRPDIRRAEEELHAATANIGVAVAEFYPTVKLNGNVGFNALDAKKLFSANSLQYQFGPTVSLPIFEGGRLKSTLELREAQQQEAAIAYHKTVLQAWREVVDALVAYRTEQVRRVRLAAQAAHSREALKLARARYNSGVGEFLSVLDAERTLLQAQLEEARSATAVATNFVKLYKALGGGWELTFPRRDLAAE